MTKPIGHTPLPWSLDKSANWHITDANNRIVCDYHNRANTFEENMENAALIVKAVNSYVEWQPIETAPKDKWLLLGYYNQLGKWRTVRGNWFDAGTLLDHNEEPQDSEAGWYETVENSDDLPNVWPINPTHWMSLPAPPEGVSS